ncbi:MAG: hypothetical protein K2Y18_02850 [Alphaproteobacteria bacterium]|jgi:hypothetical protein|nr:hypothetical protein [Alphaproteobacteria bacterium]
MNKGLSFIAAFCFTIILLKGFIVDSSASEELDEKEFKDLLGELATFMKEPSKASGTGVNNQEAPLLHESSRQSPAPASPKQTHSGSSPGRSDSDEPVQEAKEVEKPSFSSLRLKGPREQSPRVSQTFLARTSRSQSTITRGTRSHSESPADAGSPKLDNPRSEARNNRPLFQTLKNVNDDTWDIDFMMGLVLPRPTTLPSPAFPIGESIEPEKKVMEQPLQGSVFFLKLEECLAYERPSNSILEQLRPLDKTNYKDPEVIITLAGITDQKTQRIIRLYFQNFNDPETIIKLSGTNDEKLKKSIRKYFETKDQVLKKKKFVDDLRNKIKEKTQKVDIKGYVEDIILKNKPNVQETERVKAIISSLKSIWVTFSREITGDKKVHFETAKHLASMRQLKVERFGAKANRIFETVYEPMQDSMVYLFPRLRALGATLVLYGDSPYTPTIGQFMSGTGFIQEGCLPENFYCHIKDPNENSEIQIFLEPQPSRIVFVGSSVDRLTTDRQTVKRHFEERQRLGVVIDTLHYDSFSSFITGPLLLLQYELMAEWEKKLDPARELIY